MQMVLLYLYARFATFWLRTLSATQDIGSGNGTERARCWLRARATVSCGSRLWYVFSHRASSLLVFARACAVSLSRLSVAPRCRPDVHLSLPLFCAFDTSRCVSRARLRGSLGLVVASLAARSQKTSQCGLACRCGALALCFARILRWPHLFARCSHSVCVCATTYRRACVKLTRPPSVCAAALERSRPFSRACGRALALFACSAALGCSRSVSLGVNCGTRALLCVSRYRLRQCTALAVHAERALETRVKPRQRPCAFAMFACFLVLPCALFCSMASSYPHDCNGPRL